MRRSSLRLIALGAVAGCASAAPPALDAARIAELHFTGYFTAVAVETPAGWKLRNLHWSSPGPPR